VGQAEFKVGARLELLVLLVRVFWVRFEGLKQQYMTEGTHIGRLGGFAWLLPVPVLELECLLGHTEVLLVADGVVLHQNHPSRYLHTLLAILKKSSKVRTEAWSWSSVPSVCMALGERQAE
jgi:hypothetical protein